MNSTGVNRPYYSGLDSLRGLAILLVFFSHTITVLHPFEFGWIGVDLFFVLSGFLITDILFHSANTKKFFANFFVRRFLRIIPLYYLTLFIFFYIIPELLTGYSVATTNHHDQQIWFWMHLQNWLFVEKGMTGSPYLSHFWSLAVEEQFYIIWPFIIYFFGKTNKLLPIIIGLILCAVIVRIALWQSNATNFTVYYCNTLTRMDSILMGCLVAVLKKEQVNIRLKTIYSILIGCFIYFLASAFGGKNLFVTNPFFSTLGYTLISLFFAAILYTLTTYNLKLLTLFKDLSFLSFMGKISYGVYIFHIPVYLALNKVMIGYLQAHDMNTFQSLVIICVCCLFLTLLLSTLSFYFFEKPILTLKKYFPY